MPRRAPRWCRQSGTVAVRLTSAWTVTPRRACWWCVCGGGECEARWGCRRDGLSTGRPSRTRAFWDPNLARASARSFILCPLCARTCARRTLTPRLRNWASAFLFAATSALWRRVDHAPVVVHMASIESASTSTLSPGRTSALARSSAACIAVSSPVLFVPLVAPIYSASSGLVTTGPHS